MCHDFARSRPLYKRKEHSATLFWLTKLHLIIFVLNGIVLPRSKQFMDRLGKLVKEAREREKETIKQLARNLGVSEQFARAHVQYSNITPISPRVAVEIQKHYQIPPKILTAAVAYRNRKAKIHSTNKKRLMNKKSCKAV